MLKTLPNIRPSAQVVSKTSRLVLHPLSILVFFLQTTFFYFFYAENRYTLQSDFDQFILTYFWGALYFTGMYLFMGSPMHALIARNIPVTIGGLIYFTSMATLEAGFGQLFIRMDAQWSDFFWHVFATVAAIVPAIFICFNYFEKPLREAYGYDPKQVPYWRPMKRDSDLLQSLLPPNKRGKLLMLKAANQYVEVTTDKGRHDVRATLKSLLKHVPEKDGVHLQRSVWLHKDQIAEFGYENGNPRIIDANGNHISVSRSKVDEVKKTVGF